MWPPFRAVGTPETSWCGQALLSLPLATPALRWDQEKLRSCLHTKLWLVRQRCETNAHKLQREVTLPPPDASLPLAESPYTGGSASERSSCHSLSSTFPRRLCTHKSQLEQGIKIKVSRSHELEEPRVTPSQGCWPEECRKVRQEGGIFCVVISGAMWGWCRK